MMNAFILFSYTCGNEFTNIHTLKLSAFRGTVGRSSLFVGYGFNMQINACFRRYNMEIHNIRLTLSARHPLRGL